ncbi:LAO/AO transport system kinase [Sporomusaceae bacterium BoRhaA]|uniref:methylmalonyl Co-A mutase-associated GTPase MeaB n=1 Tax=Pelorhabdus rhamnosifermentans TaxID=2772457 RepID=UPI001C062EAF|nr:methylmalonyl Co-A mutase-associated GTPase MeaB [Pelorhabdus rhamnosifermentans]MBU2701788.1 LAO/AO transport system kinase [Pelorhabdus rhamnosifermentans]
MMEDLSKRVLAGDIRAASRLIRNLEDQIPNTHLAMREIFTASSNSHVIGITGAPGAGKSTLTDELIATYRQDKKTIGVLAVDPTSPFSGGAILGDRIRMLRHSEDEAVFVRSLATKGSLGGLSKAVGEGIHVMEALEKEKIIVETCGVGQQEVDIINHAHTVVVVLVPGMGDEIQAIKAGLMEIADIFVINKADRDGAAKLYQELLNIVAMSKKNGSNAKNGWTIPILKVGSVLEPKEFAKSVELLRDKIEEHYKFLIESNLLAERKRRKAAAELNEALWATIFEPVLNELQDQGETEKMVDQLVAREIDPYTLAEEVAQRYMKK